MCHIRPYKFSEGETGEQPSTFRCSPIEKNTHIGANNFSSRKKINVFAMIIDHKYISMIFLVITVQLKAAEVKCS